MRDVVVLGASGAGKSTLAAELARRLGVPHIDRDRVVGPHRPMESELFRASVRELTESDGWVFDGMPYHVEEIVFGRADTVVCLDYSKAVVMGRVVRRSFRQTVLRQQVGAHGPLSLSAIRSPEHPVRWAWATHAERRDQMREWPQRPALASARVVSLGSPREARRWLNDVAVPAIKLG